MKTVADFKRALKVGRVLHCIYHKEFAGRDEDGRVIYKNKDLGNRKISVVLFRSFAMETTRTDGVVTDSWCEIPKASESKIEGNSITILAKDTRYLTGGCYWDGIPEYDNAPMIPLLTYTLK